MDKGWIKLYRKILDNDGLFRSSHTFTIWCWLLLKADRKTGEVKLGRFMLSEWLKIKPSTVYQTLKRLSNMTMIKMKSNNQMTTVTILNWAKYQANPNKEKEENLKYDNEKNLMQQQSNTIQEVRNKNEEKEEDAKIPNRLVLSKGMKIAYAKEYPGITTTEIEELRLKCNAYMNMSSSNYTNPGLFFKGWLNKYMTDKRAKEASEAYLKKTIEGAPEISEEQRIRNIAKIEDMKKSLHLGVRR